MEEEYEPKPEHGQVEPLFAALHEVESGDGRTSAQRRAARSRRVRRVLTVGFLLLGVVAAACGFFFTQA